MKISLNWTTRERLEAARIIITRALAGQTPDPDPVPGLSAEEARLGDALNAVHFLSTESSGFLEERRAAFEEMMGGEDGE